MTKMKKETVYPYIPNTAPDTKRVLMEAVNAKTEREIFDVIPDRLMYDDFDFPDPIPDEYSLRRHMEKILDKNANLGTHLCFLGAGCAPHFIPSVVDEVLKRGELVTAYTSDMGDQGRGQMQFEYQSLMAELLDMEVIAFPQYDGGSSLGHAIRMTRRLTGRDKVLVASNMNRVTLEIAENYLTQIDGKYCELIPIEYDRGTGLLDLDDLKAKLNDEIAGVVIENPTFFGTIELHAREIGKLAKYAGAEFVVYADPISLGLLEAPGTYGATIACGDIHSLGLHMGAGSGVGGYVMVKDEYRYAKELKDMMYAASPTRVEGEIGFSFEASFDRTSYEIREKSAEFTGTSAGLWTAAAGVYLATMGPKGMKEVGESIISRSAYAAKKIAAIDGVSVRFSGPSFKEFVVDFSETGKSVEQINKALLQAGIIGGYDLSGLYPELTGCMLLCVTEIHMKEDIDRLVDEIVRVIS